MIAVGLLDPDPEQRLTAFVADQRIRASSYETVSALQAAMAAHEHPIVILALEGMGADARALLRDLRDRVNRVRIIVVHEETTPRVRFARRLWDVGACDAIVSRAQPSQLWEAVKRFELDAQVEEIERRALQSDLARSDRFVRFRATQALLGSLTGQRTYVELLRAFSRGLRGVVDYDILAVLLLDGFTPRFHTYVTRPVAHTVLFSLARRACDVLAELRTTLLSDIEGPLSAEDLEYVQPTLLQGELPTADARSEISEKEITACPMVAGSRVIGCVVAASSGGPLPQEDLYSLHLISSHLAVAVEHARVLQGARELSDTDPLTGTYNRRFLDKILEAEWARAQRYSLQLSVLLVDIDHFSEVNELRGRSAGDAVLINVAEMLRELVRSADRVIRFSGDQFLVLLPETGPSGAQILIERIRIGLKQEPVELEGGSLHVSISAGVASHPTVRIDAPVQLVSYAQDALDRAKSGGRNRVAHAGRVQVGSAADEEGDQRREPRMALELPVMVLPIIDVDPRNVLRLTSVNVSTRGLAVRDRHRVLKRDSHVLAFFEDRSHPLLCKVAWSRTIDGEVHAGLASLRAQDLDSAPGGRRWGTRRAVVVTESPEYTAVARRVLRATNHVVDVVEPGASEISESLLGGCSLVVIGERTLRGEVGRRLLELRRETAQPLRTIVLNEELDREGAIKMISSQQVDHLISGRTHPAESLFATLTKLLRPDFFGVHRYLLAGADIKSWSVTEPSEKGLVLAGVRRVAEEVDCHPRISDLLISAVDEMLINALYVPADGLRRQLPVTIECGADGRLLCVGVLDDHGRLDVEDIYRGLEAAALVQREGIPDGAESAHLGFRIMLNGLSQLAINVEPGRRTEIIGVVDLRKSLREHRASAPSLGIFKT